MMIQHTRKVGQKPRILDGLTITEETTKCNEKKCNSFFQTGKQKRKNINKAKLEKLR